MPRRLAKGTSIFFIAILKAPIMENTILKIAASLAVLGLLGACTTTPTGPSVLVLPGTGKTFDQFRLDDSDCRNFASGQIGGTTASSAATESGVKSAAVGTVLGAAAGAAINGGRGAGVGAGTGLVFGGLSGTGAANESAYDSQRRYDYSYEQCMYAKGHRIPVSGQFSSGSYVQPNHVLPPPPPPATPSAK
jgi:hypothetical protein